MKSDDKVGITFVNSVIGRGILNNVINLSFAAFNFTPNDDGIVDADPTVACRLRMDKVCAYQLREVLNELIDSIEKAESELTEPKNEGLVASAPNGKAN